MQQSVYFEILLNDRKDLAVKLLGIQFEDELNINMALDKEFPVWKQTFLTLDAIRDQQKKAQKTEETKAIHEHV